MYFSADLPTIAVVMLIKAIREVFNCTEGRVPHSILSRNARQEGAELVVWTAEKVDRFDAWIALQEPIDQFED